LVKRRVVPRGKAFELDPRLPRGREAAGRCARRLDLGCGGHHFWPRRGRAAGIETRLFERVLVVEEHRRRAVERERQHLALGVRVVPGHRRHVAFRIELFAGVGHHLVHRLDRALGRHHRRGADLLDLQNRRRAAGTIGSDGRRHRLGIAALEHRVDLVFALALVEFFREVVDAVVVGTRHRMPELDLGDSLRRHGESEERGGNEQPPNAGMDMQHGIPPGCVCQSLQSNGQSASVR
jgi:hypothetical protein